MKQEKTMLYEPESGKDGFEVWRHSIQSICGRYNPELDNATKFSGWARLRDFSGLEALDVNCNVERIARSAADTRRDDAEYFFIILQLQGNAMMVQNDSEVALEPGDIALIDSTRPSNFVYSKQSSHQLSIHLPRQQCRSYLGFQLQGGLKTDHKSHLTKILFNLFNTGEGAEQKPHFSFFENLLVYDLLGALFAPSKTLLAKPTLHSEMLFNRVCEIIHKQASDTALCVSSVAESAGISVRYLQKLFTDRATSFSHFLETERLELAAFILRRSDGLSTKPAIGDVAASAGFSSLPHFSRSFRKHFGHPPSQHR